MNLLLDLLPEQAAGCPVRAGWRTMVQFELLLNDPELNDWQKALQALRLFYVEQPPDPKAAIAGLLWFYRCDQPAPQAQPEAAALRPGNGQRAYDFAQDAAYIYAAFRSQYGIDLNTLPEGFCYLWDEEGNRIGSRGLHWWQFRALFQGLNANQEIVKIMGYRTMDLSGLSKGEKARYQKLKNLYRLESREQKPSLSYDAYKQRMVAYVSKRFAQAADGEPTTD